MKGLRDVKLAPKIAALPALGLACLLAVGGVFAYTVHGQGLLLARMEAENLARSRTISGIFADLSQNHLEASRLLGAAGEAIDEEKLYEQGSTRIERAQQVEARLAEAKPMFARDDREQAITAVLVKELGAYRQSLVSAIEMGAVDTAMASRELALANVSYNILAAKILELVALTDDSNADAIQAIRTISESRLVDVAVLTTVLLLALGGLTFYLVPQIVRPLRRMTAVMGRLADGDREIVVPDRERGDEVGAMAKAVQVFKERAIENERLRAEQEDLKRQSEERRREAMMETARRFETTVKGVVERVSRAAEAVQATAMSLAETADATRAEATSASAAAEEASANVSMVAAATVEMRQSFQEIDRSVAHSSDVVGEAVAAIERTNGTVKVLVDAADKIGAVIDLISGVAKQTSLLALNATIEAARAGEAGRGFAIVASEVKNLAAQTAKATEEIAGQVAAIQNVSDDAARAMQGVGETIRGLSAIAGEIARTVQQQSEATGEIDSNAQLTSGHVSNVASNITNLATAVSDSGDMAQSMLQAAEEMGGQVVQLDQEVQGFLASLRGDRAA